MMFSAFFEYLENSGKLASVLLLAFVIFLLTGLLIIFHLDERKRFWDGEEPPRLRTVMKAFRTPKMFFRLSFEKGLHLVECTDRSCSEIIVPDGVTVIGAKAFSRCSAERIILPESVRVIEKRAFSDCKELTELEIPDGVKRLDWDLFKGCSKLREVRMPYSMSMSSGMFSHCDSLERLVVHGREFAVNGGSSVNRELFNRITAILAADSDEKAVGYVKIYGSAMFADFIKKNDMGSFETLLGSEVIFPDKDIDSLIELAIELERNEMYVMLVRYKHSRFGFEDNSDIYDRFGL